jgi:hypothetical protein
MLPSARVRAVIPAVVLIAIAVWEIVATVRAPDGVPDDDAWARAAAIVREQHRRDDLIVFAPGWADPIGRLHLGDLIPIEAAARLDAGRFPVIWELSIRGARAAETAGLEPVFAAEVGGVTVRRFEQKPARLVADLGALAPARDPGLYEVGFTPRWCVQVTPPAGQSVTLDYGNVPLGKTLVVGVGLADVFTRRDIRDPGRLDLKIDGQLVEQIQVGVDDGWRVATVPTEQGMHRVEIVATALGPKARDRRICFAAEARR